MFSDQTPQNATSDQVYTVCHSPSNFTNIQYNKFKYFVEVTLIPVQDLRVLVVKHKDIVCFLRTLRQIYAIQMVASTVGRSYAMQQTN